MSQYIPHNFELVQRDFISRFFHTEMSVIVTRTPNITECSWGRKTLPSMTVVYHLLCDPQRPPVVVWPQSWTSWGPPTLTFSSSSTWGSPPWISRTLTWTPSDTALPRLRCQGITCTPMVKCCQPVTELHNWQYCVEWNWEKSSEFYSSYGSTYFLVFVILAQTNSYAHSSRGGTFE